MSTADRELSPTRGASKVTRVRQSSSPHSCSWVLRIGTIRDPGARSARALPRASGRGGAPQRLTRASTAARGGVFSPTPCAPCKKMRGVLGRGRQIFWIAQPTPPDTFPSTATYRLVFRLEERNDSRRSPKIMIKMKTTIRSVWTPAGTAMNSRTVLCSCCRITWASTTGSSRTRLLNG